MTCISVLSDVEMSASMLECGVAQFVEVALWRDRATIKPGQRWARCVWPQADGILVRGTLAHYSRGHTQHGTDAKAVCVRWTGA